MNCREAVYRDIRDAMKPGDVIAFGGKEQFSEIIKWATRSTVSHVGVVLQTRAIYEERSDRYFNQIIESTSLNGFSGVTISRLSDRIFSYPGEIWWLPLSDKVRNRLSLKKFFDFLIQQDRKPYDLPQAIGSALDALDSVPLIGRASVNLEDFSRFFCSELVAASLEAGGAVASLNASEVTPADLCMFKLYKDDYYRLKGEAKVIKGFNSIEPDDWAQTG